VGASRRKKLPGQEIREDPAVLLSAMMPISEILAALVAERDRLNRAIEALQGPVRRRGRPPKNPSLVAAMAAPPTTNHKRGMSAAARKAASQRMKAYWAKRRTASAKH